MAHSIQGRFFLPGHGKTQTIASPRGEFMKHGEKTTTKPLVLPDSIDQRTPYAGFDLDGVIADVHHGMAESMQRATGVNLHWSQWHAYDFFKFYGMEVDQFLELLVRDRVLETAPPAGGAVGAMQAIREAGLKIAIVTARGFHPSADAVTRDWLTRHNIPFDDLIVVHNGASKADALNSLGRVVSYVDDHIGNLEDLHDNGIAAPLYLMSQPWNASDERFERVRDLPEYSLRVIGHHARSMINRYVEPAPESETYLPARPRWIP
jgi:5'(3')-deoxyribonucleotidase